MGSVIGVVDSFSIHGITKDLSRIRKAREFLTVTMKQGCTYINGGPCGELLLMTASICHRQRNAGPATSTECQLQLLFDSVVVVDLRDNNIMNCPHPHTFWA